MINNIKSKTKIIYSSIDIKKVKKYKNYFDFVIENSGSVNGIQDGFKMLKNNGIMVFGSHPHKNKKIKLDPFDFIKGKKIYGSWGGGLDYEKNCNRIFKIFRSIKNFDRLFNQNIYSLDNINNAIQDLKSSKVLRPIVKL